MGLDCSREGRSNLFLLPSHPPAYPLRTLWDLNPHTSTPHAGPGTVTSGCSYWAGHVAGDGEGQGLSTEEMCTAASLGLSHLCQELLAGPPPSLLQAGATSFKKPTSPGPAQAGLQVALGGCYFRARSTASSFMATARSPFTCSRPLM